MKKIKLAFIGTYPELVEQLMEVTRSMTDISIVNVSASFEEAAEKALKMENRLDAILSRGGTADYIERVVHIPVIHIPIAMFDLAKEIYNLGPGIKEVAFIHYHRAMLGIHEIEKMYHIKVREYLFEDYNDIESNVLHAKSLGIEVIIGGAVAAEIAGKYNLIGIAVGAGPEAVSRAISEARQVLHEKEKERNKSAQVATAFATLLEGIIVLDEEKRVVVFNSASEEIFGRSFSAGEPIDETILDEDCRKIFENYTNWEATETIRQLNGKIYAVSHAPVFMGNKFAGTVSRYEDITKVQKLEQKIRREVHFKGFVAKHSFEDIIGQSKEMKRAVSMAKIYAKADSNVLIEGESGTGKEYFAQSIHNASARKSGPFVAVNCTAIPESLLESELFGYEAGAFTGAQKGGKQGLFEIAHGGTLFLDEIGEIPLALQTRLLRVLQEQEIMRVGGSRVIPVDVRVISATNKDLLESTRNGDFRVDLYYRLNVLHLAVPPLRNRTGDIPLLCREFLRQNGWDPDAALSELLPHLEQYDWPGNVRELQNVMERWGVLQMFLKDKDLAGGQAEHMLGLAKRQASPMVSIPYTGTLKEITEQVEAYVIDRVLKECGNNQEEAARVLGIGKTTLWRKVKQTEPAGGNE